jgi:hypothetical protein
VLPQGLSGTTALAWLWALSVYPDVDGRFEPGHGGDQFVVAQFLTHGTGGQKSNAMPFQRHGLETF